MQALTEAQLVPATRAASKWYNDASLVDGLPFPYRAYSAYSRVAGSARGRSVRGGSLLLRILRRASGYFGFPTVVPLRVSAETTLVVDFADERILEVIHEIRGENPECRALSRALSAGDSFIDVGANYGSLSILAARAVGVSGMVIAVEPQQRLAGLLSQSVRLSGIDNCLVRAVACGATHGYSELLVPDHDSGRAGLFPAFSGRLPHSSVRVPVVTLDALASDAQLPGRLVVKIDVEGNEMAVLDGAVGLISSRKPTLMIELNPWSAAAAGGTVSDLLSRVESFGYSSYATPESYPEPVDRASIDLRRQSNIIVTP